MIKAIKRLFVGILAGLTSISAVGLTNVYAGDTSYYSDMTSDIGIITGATGCKLVPNGNISEPYLRVNGKNVYCADINTDFENGYKTRYDAKDSLTYEQIQDIALSLEYVKQYSATHTDLTQDQFYLLEQCIVWSRLSKDKSWNCDNLYVKDVDKNIQDTIYNQASTYVSNNKDNYDCGGYIYKGSGQDVVDFWVTPAIGKLKIVKTSANPDITNNNSCYSLEGAVYGVYQNGTQVTTLTTKADGTTDEVSLKKGNYIVKEISAPKGFALDTSEHQVTVSTNQTATVSVSDQATNDPMLIEIEKIDNDREKVQGGDSLAGAEFTVKYYNGFYSKDTLPSQATRTWVIQTKDLNGRYVTALTDKYKVSGDDFYYSKGGTPTLPLGTITVEETKAPEGYKLEGAYIKADGTEEKVEGVYIAQIKQNGDLAFLEGGNLATVNEKVIRGGVKVQKRDIETTETTAQGSATLEDAEFNIVNLSDNPVVVEGNTYANGEVVKTLTTDVNGYSETSNDTLPYGHYKIVEATAPKGYLNEGVTEREFDITEDGVIVDMTSTDNSILNQIKRGDLEGVKIADTTHKRLSNVPFKITSKTTGESHIVVTDDNGYFST